MRRTAMQKKKKKIAPKGSLDKTILQIKYSNNYTLGTDWQLFIVTVGAAYTKYVIEAETDTT